MQLLMETDVESLIGAGGTSARPNGRRIAIVSRTARWTTVGVGSCLRFDHAGCGCLHLPAQVLPVGLSPGVAFCVGVEPCWRSWRCLPDYGNAGTDGLFLAHPRPRVGGGHRRSGNLANGIGSFDRVVWLVNFSSKLPGVTGAVLTYRLRPQLRHRTGSWRDPGMQQPRTPPPLASCRTAFLTRLALRINRPICQAWPDCNRAFRWRA